MPSAPIYLASDIHLGAVPSHREQAFLNWLEDAATKAGEIILNGDLFDFWFEFRKGVPRGHTVVLATLSEIVRGGVPVSLMGGNHDWWGGSYLRDEIGLVLYHDSVVLELAGYRTFLAHGDGLGRGDLGYRLLRAVLRGRVTHAAFRWLPPELGAKIARRVSVTDVDERGPSEEEKTRSAALEAWALEKLRTEPELDLVVLGHTHVPQLIEAGAGRWYVNGGDWVRHQSFLVLSPGEPPCLEEWAG